MTIQPVHIKGTTHGCGTTDSRLYSTEVGMGLPSRSWHMCWQDSHECTSILWRVVFLCYRLPFRTAAIRLHRPGLSLAPLIRLCCLEARSFRLLISTVPQPRYLDALQVKPLGVMSEHQLVGCPKFTIYSRVGHVVNPVVQQMYHYLKRTTLSTC